MTSVNQIDTRISHPPSHLQIAEKLLAAALCNYRHALKGEVNFTSFPEMDEPTQLFYLHAIPKAKHAIWGTN